MSSKQPRRAVIMPLDNAVADEILHATHQILGGQDNKVIRKRLSQAITQLTEDALTYYIDDVMSRLELNMVAKKTVDLGMASCRKGFGIMINGMMRLLTRRQLEVVAQFLQEKVIHTL